MSMSVHAIGDKVQCLFVYMCVLRAYACVPVCLVPASASVCVCVVRKKRGLGTASVHCPLNGLTYYFNQVVTVSFPLILCNNFCITVNSYTYKFVMHHMIII